MNPQAAHLPVPNISAETAPRHPSTATGEIKPTEIQPTQASSPEVARAEVQPSPVGSTPVANPAPTNVVQNQPVAASPPHATHVHIDSEAARKQFEVEVSTLPVEDGDLIEKQWVDKTEEAIDKSKDDPHLEDTLHHTLNKTYIKKRFNIDVS